MSASCNRIPDDSVLRAPGIRHLIPDIPQLSEELRGQAILQDLYGPAFQRFRVQPDASVDQLQVMVAELLEQLVILGERFRHHIGVGVAVGGVVDLLDREAVRVQVMRL